MNLCTWEHQPLLVSVTISARVKTVDKPIRFDLRHTRSSKTRAPHACSHWFQTRPQFLFQNGFVTLWTRERGFRCHACVYCRRCCSTVRHTCNTSEDTVLGQETDDGNSSCADDKIRTDDSCHAYGDVTAHSLLRNAYWRHWCCCAI